MIETWLCLKMLSHKIDVEQFGYFYNTPTPILELHCNL